MSAAVSRQGREVILNSVATASKVAQALNTPETKIATTQVFETLQSIIDFFASETGRKVIATAGECLNQVCEVAASPESSIFLAEIATNICHAMDVEAQRKADAAATECEEKERDAEFIELEDKHGPPMPFSPTSSAADTGFETESNASEAHYNRFSDDPQHRRGSTSPNTSFTPLAQHYPAAAPPPPPPPPQGNKKKHIEKRASRSAHIEKDVLLKMGVDPAMIGEIQRVLDTLAAEEETALMAREDANGIVGSDDEMLFTDEEDGDEDAMITHAFGLRSSSPPPSVVQDAQLDTDEQKAADEEERDPNAVILPEWHEEPLRQALRRRHTRDADRIAQRNTYATQAQEMAHVLAQRRVKHGDLSPADEFACRAISLVLTYGLLFVLLMALYNVSSKLLRS